MAKPRRKRPIPAFSPGADNLLQHLNTWGRPHGTAVFPEEWQPTEGGIGNSEAVGAWFRRCIDDFAGGDPTAAALEENCAVFVSVSWENKVDLLRACIQVIVAGDKDLSTFYAEGSDEVQYLRLDFDRSTLGPMFTESLPHVHTKPHGAPRFPLESSIGNLVMDFLDFLYRNFFHRQQWMPWARRVWGEAKHLQGELDPLPLIEAAFQEGRFGVLLQSEHQESIKRMKRAWREWKDDRFRLRIDVKHARALSYGG